MHSCHHMIDAPKVGFHYLIFREFPLSQLPSMNFSGYLVITLPKKTIGSRLSDLEKFARLIFFKLKREISRNNQIFMEILPQIRTTFLVRMFDENQVSVFFYLILIHKSQIVMKSNIQQGVPHTVYTDIEK